MNSRKGAGRIASHIKLAELVLSDRGKIIGGNVEQIDPSVSRTVLRQRPHAAAYEIAEHIKAGKCRCLCPVIDVAANYRVVALAVIIVKNGQRQPGH